MSSNTPMNHFIEQGHSVFVVWQPLYDCHNNHKIGILSSGDYEVTCQHETLDLATIRVQVKSIIARKQLEKKNQ